jgi:hypothetical protein
MTSTDPLLQALAGLPAAATDDDRDGRVRRRCHALLAAQRRAASRRPAARPVESLLVSAFGLLYLVALVINAARAYGL